MTTEKTDYYIENVFATERIEQIIKDIRVGDNVKAVLRLKDPVNGIDAERLWFKVLKVNEDFTILVELDSDPAYIKSLSGVDRLTITRQNIIDVIR